MLNQGNQGKSKKGNVPEKYPEKIREILRNWVTSDHP